MRIGELARRTGLTVETLRFYERAGVLGSVTRDASGYRVYDEQTYRTLVAVRWAQELGLRLEDIAGALAGVDGKDPRERIETLQRTVDDRLATIRAEIARLELTMQSLQALRSIPFAGDCVIPAAFVDELVRAHERGLDESAVRPSPAKVTAPRKPAAPRRPVRRAR